MWHVVATVSKPMIACLLSFLQDNTHGMKFAVIENEFGEVGIDEKVLAENVEEEVIEVMNGCICCTVRGDCKLLSSNLLQ
jgi:G3E family GTPase